jgi:Transglutaminase-like superfamily
VAVEKLPEEALVFLLASRFCDSDRLLDLAWTLFKDSTPGWARVQAICDFVNQRFNFGYEHARVTRTASEAYQEGRGVCRDYAHLAVAFCRADDIRTIPGSSLRAYLTVFITKPNSSQSQALGRWHGRTSPCVPLRGAIRPMVLSWTKVFLPISRTPRR